MEINGNNIIFTQLKGRLPLIILISELNTCFRFTRGGYLILVICPLGPNLDTRGEEGREGGGGGCGQR